jgi:enoyl-CoA hydratase/carnithine racemase
MNELNTAMEAFDKDPSIGAMVITGSDKAFAAGADITEMAEQTFPNTYGIHTRARARVYAERERERDRERERQ